MSLSHIDAYIQAWRLQIERGGARLVQALSDTRPVYQEECLDLFALTYACRALDTISNPGDVLSIYKPFIDRLHAMKTDFAPDRAIAVLGLPNTFQWADCDPDEVGRHILMRMPHVATEVALIHRVGCTLPDILMGRVSFMDAVSPEADVSMLEALYFGSSSVILPNVMFSGVFEAILSVKKTPLRVLEIGAGTGGATASISHLVERFCVEYWFTDVSHVFLGVARRRLRNPLFRFEILNIEDTAAFDTWAERQRFDVVIAANSLHTVASLPVALNNISRVMSDNGCLLLLEMDQIPRWAEFIFSAAPDWWNARDCHMRSIGPLARPAQWHSVINTAIGESFSAITPEFMPHFREDYLRQFPQIILATRNTFSVQTDGQSPNTCFSGGGREDKQMAFSGPSDGEKVVAMRRAVVITHLDVHGRCKDLAPALRSDDQLVIGAEPGVASAFLSMHEKGIYEFCLLLDHQWIDKRLFSPSYSEEDAHALLDQWYGALCFVREVLVHPGKHQISVILIGGQSVGDERPTVALSGYYGLFSAAAVEYPRAALRLFDADPALDGSALANSILRFLKRPFAREELAERRGILVTPILSRSSIIRPKTQLLPMHFSPKPIVHSSDGVPAYVLRMGRTGDLDGLNAVTRETTPLAPHELELEIHYAALNYRDVLKSIGKYPLDGGDYMDIGDEATGIVKSVGRAVDPTLVGRRVMVLGANLLASHAVVNARQVIPIPDTLSLIEAATMPVAYLTAHYALLTRGRLRAGHRVLIHAAAGGVGLAAIRIAKSVGAEVFATASQPKQSTVMLWGADHVFDSRSLDFEADVLALTSGQGVDVVLNSLSGTYQMASLRVLKDFGQFVEIGKRDLYEHSTIDQYDLRRNVSFHVVDMSKLPIINEDAWSRLRDEVITRIEAGSYTPLPYYIYRAVHIGHALRTMATGRHRGKILVATRDPSVEPTKPLRRRIRNFADMALIVTGGLTGLGLEIARTYAMTGAGHLILVSRTSSHAQEAYQALSNSEAISTTKVSFIQGDIASPGVAEQVIAEAKRIAEGKHLLVFSQTNQGFAPLSIVRE